jgi:hypothetical protein
LVRPVDGRQFRHEHAKACATCSKVVDRIPLARPINAGAELALLRSVIVDVGERRVPAAEALAWLRSSLPNGSDRVGRQPRRH